MELALAGEAPASVPARVDLVGPRGGDEIADAGSGG